jgi:uncharacterized protein YodC (DUF2158 family)
MAEDFRAGDVVQLKSGGPPMTVDGYDDAGMVVCSWFGNKTKRRQSRFAEATLQRTDTQIVSPSAIVASRFGPARPLDRESNHG